MQEYRTKQTAHQYTNGKHSSQPYNKNSRGAHACTDDIMHSTSSAHERCYGITTATDMVRGGKTHPTMCGLECKLYSRYERVQPIVDSILHLYRYSALGSLEHLLKSPTCYKTGGLVTSGSASSYQTRNSEKQSDGTVWERESNFMQRPPKHHSFCSTYSEYRRQPTQHYPGSVQNISRLTVLCEGCGTLDPSKISMDERAGEWVCQCGVVGARCPSQSDYKETNSTDKSEARAEKGHTEKRKQRFDHVGVNDPNQTKRIKAEITSACDREECSVVPSEIKSKFRLGLAVEIANKGSHQVEDMDKKHVSKLIAVIKEINVLVAQMAPEKPEVGRVIRMKTDRIYRASYRHSKVCNNNPHCQMALVAKPARVIAHKLFVYTVEQLCKGTEHADGVSKTQLTSLHERVSNSQIFRMRDNATQHEAVLAMINSLDTSDICAPCSLIQEEGEDDETALTPFATTKLAAAEQAKLHSDGNRLFERQDSGLLPSPVMLVREAVFKLSNQFNFSSAICNAAVDALGDREFANVIKNDIVVPQSVSKFGKAYILLRSIQEDAEVGSGAGSSSQKVFSYDHHIQRVNMCEYDVQHMVAQMRQLLPKRIVDSVALSANNEDVDDDTFY